MNSKYPKISVITVTYNAERTIGVTLESVATQSYPYVEHIIVDGDSSDATLAMIEQAVHLVKLLSEPDKGIYDAMNKGLQMATGDYVCFLNSGDSFFSDDALRLLFETFDFETADSPDILYGETAIVNHERRFLRMRRLSAPENLTWRSFEKGMLVCHQAFIVRREIAEPYDLSYRFSSDVDWCIRMMKKSSYIHNSHLILINYLNEGLTTANRWASLKERFKIMKRYYGFITTLTNHFGFIVRGVVKR